MKNRVMYQTKNKTKVIGLLTMLPALVLSATLFMTVRADETGKVADETNKVADETSKVADETSKVTEETGEVEEISFEELLEGVEIDGDDYIFEYESPAKFWLKKMNGDEELAAYETLKYTWSSNRESVAKFSEIINHFGECAIQFYPALKRVAKFEVHPGEAEIQCEISDERGHTAVVSKKLTVYGGSAIKSLKIGKWIISEKKLASEGDVIYSNLSGCDAKVDLRPEADWAVDGLYVYCKGKEKNITNLKKFRLKKNWDITLSAVLKNIKNGYTVSYRYRIKRYKKHTISYNKWEKGDYILSMRPGWPPSTWRERTLKYRKKSRKQDIFSFYNLKDLYKKMKEEFGYDQRTIKYKNGKIIYKELFDLPRVYICKNKKDDKKAKKKLQKKLWIYYSY